MVKIYVVEDKVSLRYLELVDLLKYQGFMVVGQRWFDDIIDNATSWLKISKNLIISKYLDNETTEYRGSMISVNEFIDKLEYEIFKDNPLKFITENDMLSDDIVSVISIKGTDEEIEKVINDKDLLIMFNEEDRDLYLYDNCIQYNEQDEGIIFTTVVNYVTNRINGVG